MEKYDRSETRSVKTGLGVLRYHRNWDLDGAIVMENPQTISRYRELRNAHPDTKALGVFFAFSKEQFDNGVNELISQGKIQSVNELMQDKSGAIGTKEALDAVYGLYAKNQERIKAECCPQEVYFYEYNNHECMYGNEDAAYDMVVMIFGKKVAKGVHRV